MDDLERKCNLLRGELEHQRKESERLDLEVARLGQENTDLLQRVSEVALQPRDRAERVEAP